VGHGTHVGGLSLFPIWTDAPTVSGLDTGTAARVQVDEREGSPVVGELALKNRGPKPALLVAGELFEGGWQHRAMGNELPQLIVADAAAWRTWLAGHHDDPLGVWLTLAKKGTTEPTSLTYDQALDESLCYGWIDGQVRRRDEYTYQQGFTPRRARSA
jgi:hypothetical protein